MDKNTVTNTLVGIVILAKLIEVFNFANKNQLLPKLVTDTNGKPYFEPPKYSFKVIEPVQEKKKVSKSKFWKRDSVKQPNRSNYSA